MVLGAGDTGVVQRHEWSRVGDIQGRSRGRDTGIIQGCRGGSGVGGKEIHRGGLTVQSGVLQDVRVLTLRGASRGRGLIQGFYRGKLYRCGCCPNVNSGMFPRVTQRCNTDRSR